MTHVPARTTPHPDLVAIQPVGLFATLEQKRAVREIRSARLRGVVVAATEVAKVEAVADVSQSALIATSEVCGLEAALSQRNPSAQPHLQHITACCSVAMGNIVMKTGKGV